MKEIGTGMRLSVEHAAKNDFERHFFIYIYPYLYTKMNKKSDDLPDPMEVVQDNHLLGVMFLLFFLMQLAWMLRPIFIC